MVPSARARARAESALQSGSAPERRAAYTVLGALADPKAVALFTAEVEKLTRGEVAAEVSLELIQAAESKDSAPLHIALDARKAQETDAALARWVESMEGGDAARGDLCCCSVAAADGDAFLLFFLLSFSAREFADGCWVSSVARDAA